MKLTRRQQTIREYEHRQVVEALANTQGPTRPSLDSATLEARIWESEGEYERLRVREALLAAIEDYSQEHK